MSYIISILPKILYSLSLIFLATLLAYEAYNVWATQRIRIKPFVTSSVSGAESKHETSFNRRLVYEVRKINLLYETLQEHQDVIPSTDQIPRAVNIGLDTNRLRTNTVISSHIYGINVENLLGWIRDLAYPPLIIDGQVLHSDSSVEILVDLIPRNSPRIGNHKKINPRHIRRQWKLKSANAEMAAETLACQIFYQTSVQKSSIFKAKTAENFCDFTKALEKYLEYKKLIFQEKSIEGLAAHLNDSTNLLEEAQKDDYIPALKILGIIFREKNELHKSKEFLERYLLLVEEKQISDTYVQKLVKDLGLATRPSKNKGTGAEDDSLTIRPLEVGLGISMLSSDTAGSICCFVQKPSSDDRYLLTADTIVRGFEAGGEIIHPSALDGGTRDNLVGYIDSVVTASQTSGYAAGALVRLSDNVKFKQGNTHGLDIIGVMNEDELFQNLMKGDVFLEAYGRTSGIVKIQVSVVGVDIIIGSGQSIEQFKDLIAVRRVQPTKDGRSDAPFQYGDTGGPVVTPDGRLIGMIYAMGFDQGYVIPITQIFDTLGVSLAKER